jgi:hypothetical protein
VSRRLLVTIDCNRVTCGKCEHLTKDSTASDAMWACELFGREAALGYVSSGKRHRSPSRARICLDAEAECRR